MQTNDREIINRSEGAVDVSVIVPVYNAEQYLEQCLDSILAQTLTRIEVILVDDGSADDSLQILARYALKDERIRVLHQENAGAGAARNTGLAAAKGMYLSFLDADDFFEPDMLEAAFRKAQAENSDFVVFRSDQYFTEKKEFRQISWTLREKEIPPYSPFSHRQMTDNIFKVFVGWAWDKLYRHDFVEAHHLRFQEQRTSNDLYFVFSAVALAKRISVVDRVLAHQRRDAKNSVSKVRENTWFCFYDALLALRRRLQEEDLYRETEKDFINYCVHAILWNVNTLAEPTRSELIDAVKREWSRELGIEGKDAGYFYNKKEYLQYSLLFREKK